MTHSEINHHTDSEEAFLRLVCPMLTCNVCYTVKGPNKLSKKYAAINDDSEENQVISFQYQLVGA